MSRNVDSEGQCSRLDGQPSNRLLLNLECFRRSAPGYPVTVRLIRVDYSGIHVESNSAPPSTAGFFTLLGTLTRISPVQLPPMPSLAVKKM